MKLDYKLFVLVLAICTVFYPIVSLAQCSLTAGDCSSMGCISFDPDLCQCVSCPASSSSSGAISSSSSSSSGSISSSSGSICLLTANDCAAQGCNSIDPDLCQCLNCAEPPVTTSASASSSSGFVSGECTLTSADCADLNCASFDPDLCKCINCALGCKPPKIDTKYKVTLSNISGDLIVAEDEIYRLKITKKLIRSSHNTLLKNGELTQYNNEQHLCRVRHLDDDLSSTNISTRRLSLISTFTARCSDKDTEEAVFDLPFDFTFEDLAFFANWQCVGTFVNDDIIGTCAINSYSIEGSTQEFNLTSTFVAKPL